VPSFLRRYTSPLLSAPVSHITSFLILHELTAIIPLVGLAAVFHYTNWLPTNVVEGVWVQQGIEKWGRYFKRKGWVRDDGDPTGRPANVTEQQDVNGDELSRVALMESRGEGWRWVLEVATAWAVIKALMPLRIIGCVWATPWFARVAVLPITRVFGRFGRGA
jgi:hypothetical protein